MRKEELRQVYYLQQEIKMWQKELENLKSQSPVKSPIITGMPRGGTNYDCYDSATAIADYELTIKRLLSQAQVQRQRILDYIESIEDSLIKQIILNRHVFCMTWDEVACCIGGGNTKDGVRMNYNRFFEK